MKRFLYSILLLAGMTAHAHAGIEIAAITALLSTTIVGSITIGSVVVSAALSIGLSYAARALQGSGGSGNIQSQAPSVNDPSASVSTRQAAPPKRIIYGQAHVGGALFFEQVKPPYLYRGYLVADHLIDSVQKIIVGTNEISFAALTPNSILTPLGVDGQPNYPGRLQVSIRLGSDTQAIDPLLARDFTSLDTGFRQRGIATVVLRYHYGTDWNEHQALWGVSGDPNIFFVVNGLAVYDPRDPTQSITDKTTWKFSSNATLVQNDYLRRPFGGRIDYTKIPYDRVAADADYDDGLVACLDGSFIKRYTCDGLVLLNQSPAAVLGGMQSANRGRVVQDGGYIWAASSRPLVSVATIYDNILAGGIDYQNDKAKRDVVNTVQTRFISDDREYNLVDGPLLQDATQLANDGEPLTATLSLPFTRDYRRVERLQKAFRDTSRLGKTLTVPVDLRILAEATDRLSNNCVTMESTIFPRTNDTYQVGQLAFAEGFSTLTLTMNQYQASIETDWIASRDEMPFTVAALNVT